MRDERVFGLNRFASIVHRPRIIAFLIVAIVLTYGVVYPNLHVLIASFTRDKAWTLSNYTQAFSQSSTLEAMWSSVLLSLLTVGLCALVGIPLAFVFERYEFPARRVFATLAALPLVLPPLVGTVAFVFLCGESGILARLVQKAFNLNASPWSLRGWGALLLFHTYTMYPFFYMLVGAGLRRIDAGLSEAARSLGAGPIRTLVRVVFPQLTPSLVAAGLLTFMTSMASFSAPLFFGGQVRLLTLEIFTARQRGDVATALTETVMLAAISLLALFFFQRYEGTRQFVSAAMKGTTKRRAVIKSGKARALAALVGVGLALILALPVVTLVIISFARDGVWTTQLLPPEYTIDNYRRIVTREDASGPLVKSLLMAGLAALAALVWSFCVTSLVEGRRTVGRRVISLLILIPWALPGTVVAVAIAEAYGKENLFTGSYILVGTFWILPVIYFLRFMPLVVRSVQVSMEQMDPALEEAASSLGARWWRRFVSVRLPLILPGAIAGTLLVFVIALGEYVASVLVYVPRNRPISIAIAAAMRDFNLGTAAAYGVVLILFIALTMIAASRIERASDSSA